MSVVQPCPCISAANSKPGIFNTDPLNTYAQTLRAVLSAVSATKGNKSIAFLGDSLTAGSLSSPAGASLIATSWPSRLANLLSLAGIPCETDSFFGDAGTGSVASYVAYNPKLTFPAGWSTFAGGNTCGGLVFVNNTTINPVTFAPDYKTDTLDVFYLNFTGYSNFVLSNGTTNKTITQTNGSGVFAKATLGPGDGTTVGQVNWTFTKSTANLQIVLCGMHAYNSTYTKLGIFNWGLAASNTTTWNDNSSSSWAPLLAIPVISPNHIHNYIGSNDPTASIAAATTISNLNAILAVEKGTSSVTGGIEPQYDASVVTLANQDINRTALRSVYGTAIPYVDIYRNWGTHASEVTAGLYDDTVHPNATGNDREARDFIAFLRAMEAI